jgi:flagellin
MRELAVQSANDTYTDSDRKELQSEIKQLTSEIDRIANTTEFNTRKLLEGSARGVADAVPGTARINNNSQVALDSIKTQAMMNSVSNDNSWNFDGAFMLIKTNQTKDAEGTSVYNANDFKLVGPDGKMYDFKELGGDSIITANELRAGTIIADGGAVEKIDQAGDKLSDAKYSLAPMVLGAAITHNEFNKIDSGSVLSSGSTFTLKDSGTINLGGTTGATNINYTAGVLGLTVGTNTVVVEPGKSVRLDDGTILRNNGGGKVTVESGSITTGTDLEVGATGNVTAFSLASQSVVADATAARGDIVLTQAANYKIAGNGEISTNVTLGNGINLDNVKVPALKEGSILARGSTISMHNITAATTTIKVLVNGNEVEISYDQPNGILKVGDDMVAPGKSITLDDGTVLSHASDLANPNVANGKIMVEAGKLILAENIDAGGNLNNVMGYTLTKDSVLAAGTSLLQNTVLMAGTVISEQGSIYPGSVTLGANGQSIQFSANIGASLEARYNQASVGETLTFIFSRYEPAANNLRDSVMAQIGANSGQTAFVSVGDMRAAALGVNNINIATKFGAATAIETINNATQRVSHQRALLGATQNRLEHTIKNLDTASENMQAAESRIRDVDMAREVMTFTKDNILQQSAQAMLAQANQIPQSVLQLLR